jgi:hypothetical protein
MPAVPQPRPKSASRRRRLAAVASALFVLAPVLTAVGPGAAAAPKAPNPLYDATRAAVAFDMPSTSALRASSKQVFAHWVPTNPISYDNRPAAEDYYTVHYLNPSGEGGKHRTYGGFLRDRPLPREAIAGSDWQLRDMETEVQQAVAAGIDGFTAVLYNLPGDPDPRPWQNVDRMLAAASNVDPGFKILLQPDMTGGLYHKDARSLAAYLAALGASPAAYRLDDGRLVLQPFTAELKSVDYWRDVLNIMQTTYRTPVAFFPLFQDERVWRDAFAPISYGMANWGSRNPAHNDPAPTHRDSPMGRVAAVHAVGKKWMQPVSLQDSRPREGIFDEAENTTNLRNTWKIAIDSGSEFVQLNTWSDFPENSQMAPSVKNGWSVLDLNAYYIAWFKTGAPPRITRDTVFLTHRLHPYAAKPAYPQSLLMQPRPWSSAPRDTVEALTLLSAPATVQVNVGGRTHSCSAPAGVGVCTVPLAAGTVQADVTRDGTWLASVTSPHKVTNTPYVQDLQYVTASSGREGTRAVTPGAPAGVATDFDGDGRSDVAVWRPATGDWFVRDFATGGSRVVASFGQAGDIAVDGDFTGDGRTDPALWRPSTGSWIIRDAANNQTQTTSHWGIAGDVPVPADYNGDGVTDLGIWRPSTGTWWVRDARTEQVIQQTQWGLEADIPVPADYTGDGRAELIIWRPKNATWYVRQHNGTVEVIPIGSSGDVPVPADYTGDGRADLAQWRKGMGAWTMRDSATGEEINTVWWGLHGDVPTPGDYNGDGRAELTFWRPATGNWYPLDAVTRKYLGTTEWGVPSDAPPATAPAIRSLLD